MLTQLCFLKYASLVLTEIRSYYIVKLMLNLLCGPGLPWHCNSPVSPSYVLYHREFLYCFIFLLRAKRKGRCHSSPLFVCQWPSNVKLHLAFAL